MPKTRSARRLRAHRAELTGALLGRVHASASHPSLGALEARVLDVSIHSTRLAFEPGHVDLVALLGERLAPLSIRFDDTPIYQGAGRVARFSQRDGRAELGVVLEDGALALDQLQRLYSRDAAAQRWARAREASAASAALDLGSWVAGLSAFFAAAQSFLGAEEAALAALDLEERTLVGEELLQIVSADIVQRMQQAGRELAGFVADLPEEQEVAYRAQLDAELGRYLACSPFLERARNKPLGYAGDYEMMNMLSRDPREGHTLFGKALNMFATQQASARANVSRIGYFSDKIKQAIEIRVPASARVLGLGVGPAKEVERCLREHPAFAARLELTLIDQEERAILQCQRVLAPLAAATGVQVRTVCESARRLLAEPGRVRALGEYDLAYSPQLFEHLADRSFAALLAVLYGALRDGGSLVVGNVAEDSPDRHVLAYLADWHPHYRSPQQLSALAETLGPAPREVRIERDPAGVNLFLIVVK
jgi:extracellular factor (EF) 3-hydroxypalmitic acid methyl ester biosynthesis protein